MEFMKIKAKLVIDKKIVYNGEGIESLKKINEMLKNGE